MRNSTYFLGMAMLNLAVFFLFPNPFSLIGAFCFVVAMVVEVWREE